MLHRRSHTPAHLLLDDTPYFITGAVKHRRRLLQDDALKQEFLRCLRQTCLNHAWELQHWVILDNHYHLLAKSGPGHLLPRLVKELHSRSAHFIRAASDCELPVWWNYWDYCPRDEPDYYRHLNYLLYNPVKHGYVTDLKDYPFSSFHAWMDRLGREGLIKQFRSHADFHKLDIQDDF